MSRLENLLALNSIGCILPASLGSYVLIHENNRCPSTTATATHFVTNPPYDDPPTKLMEEEAIYPALPPLFVGHPDIHIRNGINASRMAAAQVPDSEKAFFVADLSQIYQQHKRWKACLPEITPFYAVKCNPDPYVLRLLAGLGAGFDCASNNEIAQVLAVGGIEPSNIIYANPCKATSFIRNAAKLGVDLMTFDNSDELYKISRVHPGAKCVVRILTDDSKSLCAFGIKFGAPLVTVPTLLDKAKALNLDVVGVSFHVGSGCYDPMVYMDAISRARSVFDMGRDAGYTFSLLDIGGGFEDVLFEKAAEVLRISLEQYFPDRSKLKIIAEPGRFYVSKAFKLAVNIIARRAPLEAPATPFEDNNSPSLPSDQPVVMCESSFLEMIASDDDLVLFAKKDYINDGVYGAFNCILFDHQVVHPYVLFTKGSFHVADDEAKQMCSVWGPTCDSIDCVSPKTALPSGLRVGDWLGFDNMGAYTICAASQFNGFEVSKVVYTTGGGPHGFEVQNILSRFAARNRGPL